MPGLSSDLKAPALAGFVASATGTAASIGVVVAALTALGATATQTISAIAIMLALYGALSIVLSYRYKMPLTIVWSTPGAATLVAAGGLGFSFSESVGAFLLCAILLTVTGFWPALGRLVSAIPKPIASAMLAGVIFNFCLAPFQSLSSFWPVVLPAIVVWFVLNRLAAVWASPAAMVVLFGLASIAPFSNYSPVTGAIPNLPQLVFVAPELNLAALISIGIPLYVVTMAGQNIPGIAIMKTYGFEVPFKAALASTGLASAIGSIFGGFALNLAAISAAINADKNAHRDSSKRWLAAAIGGVFYLALALVAGFAVKFLLGMPQRIILAAAGLALLGTIISALSSALENSKQKLPAMVTFLVSASGLAVFGIGSAFWALIAGLVVLGFFQNNVDNR